MFCYMLGAGKRDNLRDAMGVSPAENRSVRKVENIMARKRLTKRKLSMHLTHSSLHINIFSNLFFGPLISDHAIS